MLQGIISVGSLDPYLPSGTWGRECRSSRGVEASSHAQTWAQGERKSWLDADPDEPPGPGADGELLWPAVKPLEGWRGYSIDPWGWDLDILAKFLKQIAQDHWSKGLPLQRDNLVYPYRLSIPLH